MSGFDWQDDRRRSVHRSANDGNVHIVYPGDGWRVEDPRGIVTRERRITGTVLPAQPNTLIVIEGGFVQVENIIGWREVVESGQVENGDWIEHDPSTTYIPIVTGVNIEDWSGVIAQPLNDQWTVAGVFHNAPITAALALHYLQLHFPGESDRVHDGQTTHWPEKVDDDKRTKAAQYAIALCTFGPHAPGKVPA
jgi:hypothetical protein